MNMNTTHAFPYRLNWSPEALADAVPLRVRNLFDPAGAPPPAGNQACIAPRLRPLRAGYRPLAPLPPRFRVG
jgi:hypothetical protein